MGKLAILNTTILTCDGSFELKTISLEESREIVNLYGDNIISAIGHQSTADIMTKLLKIDIKVNRIMFKQEPGQQALCFKLNGRPEEGKILSENEIEQIGYEFKLLKLHESKGEISDGYHTFNELYDHRMHLFAAICNQNKEISWKSLKHDDGSMYDDYFIVGINTPMGQFTYHYHTTHWHKFDVKELEKAPAWDGHTAEDVVRIQSIVK